MKANVWILVCIFCAGAFSTLGQEYDDMYFSSADRVSTLTDQLAFNKKPLTEAPNSETSAVINPTDSYSGRMVNPEYIERSQLNGLTTENDLTYFIPVYTPTAVNPNISQYQYSNTGFYSPYTGNNWGSPFYGYNASMDPFRSGINPLNPFNNMYSPLSMNMNFGWGTPYFDSFNFFGSYGMFPYFNMGYPTNLAYWGGMNNGWNNPYNMGYNLFNTGYNPYCPSINNIAIYQNDGSSNQRYYGTRTSRSSSLNHQVDDSRPAIGTTRSGREVSSQGRTGSSTYYDRQWKSNPDVNPTRTYWNSSSTTSNSNFSTNNGSRSTISHDRMFGDTNSRSSMSSGSSSIGGTRSSSPSSGTSSGSSSGRGRGNN